MYMLENFKIFLESNLIMLTGITLENIKKSLGSKERY